MKYGWKVLIQARFIRVYSTGHANHRAHGVDLLSRQRSYNVSWSLQLSQQIAFYHVTFLYHRHIITIKHHCFQQLKYYVNSISERYDLIWLIDAQLRNKDEDAV